MPLYVYALADAAIGLSDLRGIEGEPLALVDLPTGCAIVGRIDAPAAPRRETLEAQDRLVRALHDRAPALLPARFGTIVDDERTLEEHPRLQPDALGPALAGARGREQMTVRVATNRPHATLDNGLLAPDSGRQYLERRAAATALPVEVRALVAVVESLVRAERSERGRVPGLLATVYHLIDRGRSSDYRAAIAARASMTPSMSITVTGPAPAYAFGPAKGI